MVRRSSTLLVIGSLALAGCSGASLREAPAASSPPPAEQSRAESPEVALARAEHELNDALAMADDTSSRAGGAVGSPSAPAGASAAPSPEPVAPKVTTADHAEAESRAYSEPPPSPCEVACRAYASMERATQRLCSIGGDEDARCVDARSRLERATDKVDASCGGCAS